MRKDDKTLLQEYRDSDRLEELDIFEFKFNCNKTIERIKKDFAAIDNKNLIYVDMMLFSLKSKKCWSEITPLH